MATLKAILLAIAAIPKLVEQLQELLGWFHKAEKEKWFAEKTKTIQNIEKAETPEEYKQASKEINDLIKKL